jgi:hypothetical protein
MWSSQNVFFRQEYRVFKKKLYNGIPNVTVWQVLWENLHLKMYKVAIVQVKLFLKHPTLQVEVTLNHNYPT